MSRLELATVRSKDCDLYSGDFRQRAGKLARSELAATVDLELSYDVANGIIRMLYFVREPFGTFRPDIDVLFGRELLSRGHQIDFVMQAERSTDATGPRHWHGRTAWVGATD